MLKQSNITADQHLQENSIEKLTAKHILEHTTGIDLTVSSTLKKPSKNYTCFILRRFGLFLIIFRQKTEDEKLKSIFSQKTEDFLTADGSRIIRTSQNKTCIVF